MAAYLRHCTNIGLQGWSGEGPRKMMEFSVRTAGKRTGTLSWVPPTYKSSAATTSPGLYAKTNLALNSLITLYL